MSVGDRYSLFFPLFSFLSKYIGNSHESGVLVGRSGLSMVCASGGYCLLEIY